MLKKIWADFNAITEDNNISLKTKGSRKSIEKIKPNDGDWVVLSDDELWVWAIIKKSNDYYVAEPVWETMEELVQLDEFNDVEILELRKQFRTVGLKENKNYLELLQLLPIEEYFLEENYGDFLRSRAYASFGHKELAILIIEHVLQTNPKSLFVHHYLDILSEVDLAKALNKMEYFNSTLPQSALLSFAYSSLLSKSLRLLNNVENKLKINERILKITADIENQEGYYDLPSSGRAAMHNLRAYSFLHLDNRPDAMKEFEVSIQSNPQQPEPYLARGTETFPSEKAVEDLKNAIKFNDITYWSAYYLAYYHLTIENYKEVEYYCDLTLMKLPPKDVKANVEEWKGIALSMLDAEENIINILFENSLLSTKDKKRVNINILEYRKKYSQQPPSTMNWRIYQDRSISTQDLLKTDRQRNLSLALAV